MGEPEQRRSERGYSAKSQFCESTAEVECILPSRGILTRAASKRAETIVHLLTAECGRHIGHRNFGPADQIRYICDQLPHLFAYTIAFHGRERCNKARGEHTIHDHVIWRTSMPVRKMPFRHRPETSGRKDPAPLLRVVARSIPFVGIQNCSQASNPRDAFITNVPD